MGTPSLAPGKAARAPAASALDVAVQLVMGGGWQAAVFSSPQRPPRLAKGLGRDQPAGRS